MAPLHTLRQRYQGGAGAGRARKQPQKGSSRAVYDCSLGFILLVLLGVVVLARLIGLYAGVSFISTPRQQSSRNRASSHRRLPPRAHIEHWQVLLPILQALSCHPLKHGLRISISGTDHGISMTEVPARSPGYGFVG